MSYMQELVYARAMAAGIDPTQLVLPGCSYCDGPMGVDGFSEQHTVVTVSCRRPLGQCPGTYPQHVPLVDIPRVGEGRAP